jgi:uncharacterized membrane protein
MGQPMDWYIVSKFVHVAAAVLWLGGGISHVLLASMAMARRSDGDFISTIRNVAVLGKRVLVPCTVVTLISGLTMVWLGGLGFDAWIVLGLVGILATGAIGGMVLGPMSRKTATLSDDSTKTTDAIAAGRKMLPFAKADSAMLVAIVYLMVTKPSWADTAQWLVPLAMAAALGLYFLSRKDEPANA